MKMQLCHGQGSSPCAAALLRRNTTQDASFLEQCVAEHFQRQLPQSDADLVVTPYFANSNVMENRDHRKQLAPLTIRHGVPAIVHRMQRIQLSQHCWRVKVERTRAEIMSRPIQLWLSIYSRP